MVFQYFEKHFLKLNYCLKYYQIKIIYFRLQIIMKLPINIKFTLFEVLMHDYDPNEISL